MSQEWFSCLVVGRRAEERLHGVSLVRVNMYKEDVWGEYASNSGTFDSTGRVYTYSKHVLHYQPSISKLQSQQVSVNTRR